MEFEGKSVKISILVCSILSIIGLVGGTFLSIKDYYVEEEVNNNYEEIERDVYYDDDYFVTGNQYPSKFRGISSTCEAYDQSGRLTKYNISCKYNTESKKLEIHTGEFDYKVALDLVDTMNSSGDFDHFVNLDNILYFEGFYINGNLLDFRIEKASDFKYNIYVNDFVISDVYDLFFDFFDDRLVIKTLGDEDDLYSGALYVFDSTGKKEFEVKNAKIGRTDYNKFMYDVLPSNDRKCSAFTKEELDTNLFKYEVTINKVGVKRKNLASNKILRDALHCK